MSTKIKISRNNPGLFMQLAPYEAFKGVVFGKEICSVRMDPKATGADKFVNWLENNGFTKKTEDQHPDDNVVIYWAAIAD